MTISASLLGSGPGWRVLRVTCMAGPEDRPFEEQHGCVSLSAVLGGTFEYRSRAGSASLVPGAILLGAAGHCFECGHRHGRGDECLSFQYEPALWAEIAESVPGLRDLPFQRPMHPPDWALLPFVSAAQARDAPPGALEAATFALAGATMARLQEVRPGQGPVSGPERRRILEAVRLLEAEAEGFEAPDLEALARGAGMSRFRFLRLFRRVTGVPPHQFLLRLRMQRAATRLVTEEVPVARIAFEAGFGDLSTFNRQFRRMAGCSPGEWRLRARPSS